MSRFLDNDIVLGNLFIKLIRKDIENITFMQMYDLIYNISEKLNTDENTIILVSKSSIENFAEKYSQFVYIAEDSETIVIKNKEKAFECFKNRYESYGKKYDEVFENAINLRK